MRVPSRAFVGVVVFGLITVAVTLPYTLLILFNYQPAVGAPHEFIFPRDERSLGLKLFLVVASLFSLALLVAGWRSLVHGARRDAERRRRHAELKRQMREYRAQMDQRRPPGYS